MKKALLGLQPEDVAGRLGIEDALTRIAAYWERSKEMPFDDLPHFLNPGYFQSACHTMQVAPDLSEALCETARRIARAPHLVRLAWHLYVVAYEVDPPVGVLGAWSSLREVLGMEDDLFYAVVSLGALPIARRRYTALRIPPDIQRATLADFNLKIGLHHQDYGYYGLSPRVFDFQRLIFLGTMYQIGRFQYHITTFRGPALLYENTNSGDVVALAADGTAFQPSGELYLPSRGDLDAGIWRSKLSETDLHVTGNPITPHGKALPCTVRLEKGLWTCVLKPGDPILQIHIPGRERLAFDEAGRSIEEAVAFSARHFPERPLKAIVCSGWLMDDQLEGMLPPGSNLVRFLREFYRLPGRSDTEAALSAVFGRSDIDLTAAPQDTSLRKAFVAHLRNGGRMTGGIGVLLPQRLNWGSAMYRRMAESTVWRRILQ